MTTPNPETYNTSSTLPENQGSIMGIKYNSDGSTTIVHNYRTASGRATHKQITIGTQNQKAVLKAKRDLIEKCERCSLKDATVTWEELVEAVLKVNAGAGMPWVYSQVKAGLKGPMNQSFARRYHQYISRLEADGKSVNTVSNHKSAIRRTLNYGVETGLIDRNPIGKFYIKQKFRERVWNSTDERLRLFNTMTELKSHLYWAVTLLERRPIRAVSDLFRLTDENLIRVNGRPVLRFLQKKVGGRVQKETYIPLYDKQGNVFEDLMDYFNHGRPKGCRLLFPGRNGRPMGNPKRHWNYLCKKAEITDLHIHDLKHIATTAMIEEGWTIEQMLAMGCQFSDKMIRKVYWKANAEKALAPTLPKILTEQNQAV